MPRIYNPEESFFWILWNVDNIFKRPSWTDRCYETEEVELDRTIDYEGHKIEIYKTTTTYYKMKVFPKE